MKFKDKCILIISPQPWEGIRVSKHHYAEALAQQNNRIFFLNPIKKKRSLTISERRDGAFSQIQVISFHTLLPYWFRFHLPALFQWSVRWQLQRLKKRIGKIDIVWDFDSNHLFGSYKPWKAKLHIFHATDKGKKLPAKKHPDVVLAPSEQLKCWHESPQSSTYLTPHGLCREFVELAREELLNPDPSPLKKPKHIGYFGNLAHHALDRKIFIQIISQNPQVHFHLIGPFQTGIESPTEKLQTFINFLKNQPNVSLYGAKSKSWICQKSRQIDLFFACYSVGKQYDGDNAHKILEYLATGKPLISNYLSHYRQKKLFLMPPDHHNERLTTLFQQALYQPNTFLTVKAKNRRLQFALKHAYPNHINTIEKICGHVLAKKP